MSGGRDVHEAARSGPGRRIVNLAGPRGFPGGHIEDVSLIEASTIESGRVTVVRILEAIDPLSNVLRALSKKEMVNKITVAIQFDPAFIGH